MLFTFNALQTKSYVGQVEADDSEEAERMVQRLLRNPEDATSDGSPFYDIRTSQESRCAVTVSSNYADPLPEREG